MLDFPFKIYYFALTLNLHLFVWYFLALFANSKDEGIAIFILSFALVAALTFFGLRYIYVRKKRFERMEIKHRGIYSTLAVIHFLVSFFLFSILSYSIHESMIVIVSLPSPF
jgi:hypothetical protein